MRCKDSGISIIYKILEHENALFVRISHNSTFLENQDYSHSFKILEVEHWHRAIAQVDGIPKPVYQDKEGLAKLHPIVKMNLRLCIAILQHHLGLREYFVDKRLLAYKQNSCICNLVPNDKV